MAQPGPETSWEDLAHVGWTKQQVYDTLNPLRGYTMRGLDDLHLNDASFPMFPCYNVTIGNPYVVASASPSQLQESPISVWKYDNSNGSEPYTTSWTDEWSSKSMASLTLTRGPSINLQWSVTIESIADSGFNITMSDASSESIEQEDEVPHSETIEITIPPGQTLEILRHEAITTRRSLYAQVRDIVTLGNPFEGSVGWAYTVDIILNKPGSDMQFVGVGESSSFEHELKYTGGDSETSNPVVKVAKATTTTKAEDGKKTVLKYAFPVPIEAPKESSN